MNDLLFGGSRLRDRVMTDEACGGGSAMAAAAAELDAALTLERLIFASQRRSPMARIAGQALSAERQVPGSADGMIACGCR